MTIRIIHAEPDLSGLPDLLLRTALSRFEHEFTYPLGTHDRFHVSHNGDGCRFFQALGTAAYFLYENGNHEIIGAVGAAQRPLTLPHGQIKPALYVGDLKIAAHARSGMVLSRLFSALQSWCPQAAIPAYSVVMDGTALTPDLYTGRMGVPTFSHQASVSILWLQSQPLGVTLPACSVTPQAGLHRFDHLAAGSYRMPTAATHLRSSMTAQWLMTEGGGACGRLEDTLLAKCLISQSGTDMRSAHISCFAYDQLKSGVNLIVTALQLAHEQGYPMVFVAVPSQDAPALCTELGATVRTVAAAHVYGTQVTPGPWNINTAEI